MSDPWPRATERRGLGRARDLMSLVAALAARELKVRYRRSVLGWLWSVLHPFLLMLVFLLVFSQVFRFDVADYPTYAFAGLLCWNFIQQGIIGAMYCLRVQAPFVARLPVPLAVFPAAVVLAGLVNMVLALAPLVVLMTVTGRPPAVQFPLVVVGILAATAFTLGLALLLAPLAVAYSDVIELASVGLTVLMYLTPVFYPADIVPEKLRWALSANPVAWILQVFRDPVYAGDSPPMLATVVALGSGALALCVGAWSFHRRAARIPFEL
jgi:ABC-type polysaccharide/polyol phosphate export permease